MRNLLIVSLIALVFCCWAKADSEVNHAIVGAAIAGSAAGYCRVKLENRWFCYMGSAIATSMAITAVKAVQDDDMDFNRNLQAGVTGAFIGAGIAVSFE